MESAPRRSFLFDVKMRLNLYVRHFVASSGDQRCVWQKRVARDSGNHVQFVGMCGDIPASTRVTANSYCANEKELKMAAKNKRIKKIVSWVVGLPAAIIAISEPTDLRLWWSAVRGNRGAAVVLFANGVFDEISKLKSRGGWRWRYT